jgi:hypothetical protein
MEISMDAPETLEIETLENELQQRMGRMLTRQEMFYLSIATACSQEGCELPESLVESHKRPA